MKTKINLTKRELWIIILTLITGLIFGWLFFHGSGSNAENKATNEEQVDGHNHENEKATIWTCSMHPQIRMDKPGKCPICGMELIPLKSDNSNEEALSPNELQMSDAAMKIADIQTTVIKKAYPEKEIHLLGKVQADERNISELTARFGGRIEKLYVNYTGQDVRKGQKLATIYSPELITAQKELLEAMKYKESNPDLYQAARNKLMLWDLNNDQISNIEKNNSPENNFDILSPISGTVIERNVSVGNYVKEGKTLLKVVDLSKVWVLFEAYESDLHWINVGDQVKFSLESVPGKNFSGKIKFIDRIINEKSRIAKVRVELNNPDLKLKPEMFADGIVTSRIAENKKEIMVPKTAVLWTGKRSVIYVKDQKNKQPTFEYREIELGPEAGNFYVVSSGLKEGEEVATNGVFKIDASAQLAGKTSMMNPDGGVVPNTMPGMDMGNESTEKKMTSTMDMNKKDDDANIQHKMITVAGNCEMCKDRIETAAKSIKGVISADWLAEKQMLHLSFNSKQTSLENVEKAIAKAGHDTEKFKADDSVYNALPECCLYRK